MVCSTKTKYVVTYVQAYICIETLMYLYLYNNYNIGFINLIIQFHSFLCTYILSFTQIKLLIDAISSIIYTFLLSAHLVNNIFYTTTFNSENFKSVNIVMKLILLP